MAKRCVLEQKLLLTAYMKSYMTEKSIGTKINDLDLCFEVVSRSCQPLRYIRRWISRKPLQIEAWVIQRTANRKWHIEYQMITWPMTSRDLHSILWGSTVGYPSDSLASCYVYRRRRALHAIYTTGYSLVRVQTDVHRHFSVITSVWDWRYLKNIEIAYSSFPVSR